MINYQHCTLCPRACGVDRTAGERGFCGMSDKPMVAKAMIHVGEEPVIMGEKGTGAIFFSGCTLRCSYCQNHGISTGKVGVEAKDLRKTMEQLIAQGAESIDLVTPTHFLPHVIEALQPKLPVPVVYNCGGYESAESLKALEGLVDVYLPDLKYSNRELAKDLSMAGNYFETAKAAILEMYRQTGPFQIEKGLIKKGVLIRHLVLPGNVDNSLGVLDWIGDTFREGEILVSLMSQYVPTGNQKPPMDRRVTEEEYDGVVSWMDFCGISQGFVQELSSATEELLPTFDCDGVI